MRLTSVGQMAVPAGRVLGLTLSCAPRGETLPISFDQRRHVGTGDRPGSWMAIAARLPRDSADTSRSDLDRLAAAWPAVVARHPTFRSAFTREDDRLVLRRLDVRGSTWVDHGAAPDADSTRRLVREVLDETCRPYAAPSHRLLLVEPDDPAEDAVVVVGSDHAHVDMWSLLVVLRDLLAARRDGPAALGPPAADFATHTAALAALPPAPASVRHRWWRVLAAGGDAMPCFPLPLGDVSRPVPERLVVRDVLDGGEVSDLAAYAAVHGARPTTVAVSVMATVTRELADVPLRALFPVHSRHDAGWHDAVGWFITNSVLDVPDADLDTCGEALAAALVLGSWPLADVLAPYGDMPTAPGLFALSWLDLRRLPVDVDTRSVAAQFVGAVIETDGVMVWFVLTDDGLHLRCRYPGTAEAEQSVGAWLDAVVAGLRSVAHGDRAVPVADLVEG